MIFWMRIDSGEGTSEMILNDINICLFMDYKARRNIKARGLLR